MNLSNGFMDLSDIENFARMIEEVCLLNKKSLSDEQTYLIVEKITESDLLERLPLLIKESDSDEHIESEHANRVLARILEDIGINHHYYDSKRRVVSTEGRNISWLIKSMQSAQAIAKQQREKSEKSEKSEKK